MRVGAALSFLRTGVARPECLNMRAARVKIISTGKATCSRKRNRRVLPYWLSQSFPDCADETELEPQREMQPSPGRWGRRAEIAVSDLRDIGSSGCVRGRSLLPNPRPRGAAHLKTPLASAATSACAHAGRATPARPPRPTPRSSPAAERPDRSAIGRSGVERSAEKRRGKCKGGRETAPEPRPPQRGEQEE